MKVNVPSAPPQCKDARPSQAGIQHEEGATASPFDAATAAFEAEARTLLAQLPDRAVSLCLRWLEVETQAKALDDQLTARAAELREQGAPLDEDPAMVELNAKLDAQGWTLDAVRAEIAATPATTPAGVLAKLVIWQTEQGVPADGDSDHRLACAAANDLRRLIAAGQWGRAA
ncbi:hypothetical protein [Azospirillum sp. Sh1]|uniref:hypothetical protein n=1 Tax=Azospirillum sp. Sh1 TaxID=2607285 RepID=UPI0011EF9BE7|nr:hypothetical protein [Azospirillum sp. Sh1]KAA0582709.1 hypothetical protein FZ029_01035 [Azospirillum sp. Sh1]